MYVRKTIGLYVIGPSAGEWVWRPCSLPDKHECGSFNKVWIRRVSIIAYDIRLVTQLANATAADFRQKKRRR